MIRKLTNGCVFLVQKFLPDPFLFALLLSAIVFILGIVFNGQTPAEMVFHWGDGFWGFLAFSMQMALVVILGNCLANAPIFDKILKRLAKVPKTPRQAVAFVTVVSGIACMLQWGFGLVVGAIFAKEVAKTVKKVDYRLLIASAYSTFLLTLLTSSIPLKAASNPEELAAISSGHLTETIPLLETAYNPYMLGLLLALFITLPILNALMHPSEERTVCIDPALLAEDDVVQIKKDKRDMTPAERFENSPIVTLLVFIPGIFYIAHHFYTRGFDLTIDMMNFMLFMFGMLLHKTPMNYIKAMGNAVKNAAGIILQFPFYAGIMGMMTGLNAQGVSLAGMLSEAMVSVATARTFPFFSFLSAALVNMFVPSAGGQWGVQAPVLLPAAAAVGATFPITVMSLCLGDTITNMIQPFWALPALGIAKLGVRDIMGYCVVVCIWAFILMTAFLWMWSVSLT